MDGMKPGHIVMGHSSLELSYSGIVPVADRGRVLEITSLRTNRWSRSQGHAGALMREVCQQADQNDMFLLLSPEAFGGGGLTTEQLTDWYARRFGFTPLQHAPLILIRLPRTVAQQWAASHEHA
jgi:hypothetical protein